MKTRILHFFSFIPAALFLLAGCLEQLPDADVNAPAVKDGDVVKVGVCATLNGYSYDIDTATKSNFSLDENAADRLCIGVYDKETDEKVAEQYGLSVNSKIEFDLIVGRTYMFVAVANHLISQPKLSSTYSGLIAEKNSFSKYMSSGGTMTGIVEHTVNGLYGDMNNPQYANVVIPLQRCYAKFRIKVKQAFGTNFSVKSIKIKQINTTDFWLYQPEKCFRTSDGSEDSQAMSTGDSWVSGTDEAPSDGYYTLYCPENRMGTPESLASNTNSQKKNPEIDAEYKGKCTYVELVVEGTGPLNGTVTYKFYPGANNYNNFDIVRNTVYNITVNLSQNIYETTWQVDPQWDYNLGTPTKIGVSDLTLGKTQSISFTFPSASYYYWLSGRLIKARFVDISTGAIIGETKMSVPKLSYTTGLKPGTTISFTMTPIDDFNTGYLQLYDDYGKVIYTDNTAISCTIPKISIATLNIVDNKPVLNDVSVITSKINEANTQKYAIVFPDGQGIDRNIINDWSSRHGYQFMLQTKALARSVLNNNYINSTTYEPDFVELDLNYNVDEQILDSAPNILATFTPKVINDGSNATKNTRLTSLYASCPQMGDFVYYNPSTKATYDLSANLRLDVFPIYFQLIGKNYLEGYGDFEDQYFVYVIDNPSNIVLSVITAYSANDTYPSSSFNSTEPRKFTSNSSGYYGYYSYDSSNEKYYRYETTLYSATQPLRAYAYKRTINPAESDNGKLNITNTIKAQMDYYGAKAYLATPATGLNSFHAKSKTWFIDSQIHIYGTTRVPEYSYNEQDNSILYINQDSYEGAVYKYYWQLWNGTTLLEQTWDAPSRPYHTGLTAQYIYDLIHEIKTATFTASVNSNNRLLATYNGTNGQLTAASFNIPLHCDYQQGEGFNDVANWNVALSNNYLLDYTTWTNLYRNYWMCAWDTSNTPSLYDVYSQYSEPTGKIYITGAGFSYKTGKKIMWIPEFTDDKTGWTVPYTMCKRTKYGCFRDGSTSNPDGSSREIYISAAAFDDEVYAQSTYTPDPIKVIAKTSYESFPAVTSDDRYVYIPKDAEYD